MVVRGFLVCGVHARLKKPNYWITSDLQNSIKKFQALWRGYAVRYRLKLAGPGVLKRSLCHNEDEMVTAEGKTEVSPFDYFSIEQDGKIWWFDQRTMIEWSQKNLQIANPFNRVPLTTDDMRRLRTLYYLRRKYGLPVLHTTQNDEDILESRDLRWLRLVQIFNECGFVDILHPEHFIGLSYHSMRYILNGMVEQTRWWMYEKVDGKDPYALRAPRAKIHTWIRSIRNTMHTYTSLPMLSRDIAGACIACANEMKDPADFMFFLLRCTVAAEILESDIL